MVDVSDKRPGHSYTSPSRFGGQCRGSCDSARVLSNDKQLIASTIQSLPSGSSSADKAQAIARYRSRAESQDFTDCPPDFLVAYRHYVGSWEDLQDAVEEIPSDILSGMITGFINGYKGEIDGGLSRLKANVKSASYKVRGKKEEMERMAANKYGVAIN